MSLHTYVSGLSELFKGHAASHHGARPDVPDPFIELVAYLRALFNREDLLDPLTKEIEAIEMVDEENREGAYLHAYIGFEDILVANRPPITKREFTRATLRQEVRQHVKVAALPPLLQVLFLDPPQARLQVYLILLSKICKFIIGHIGESTCRDYVRNVTAGTVLANLVPATGPFGFQVDPRLSQVEPKELKFAWLKLFNGLYEQLIVGLGDRVARPAFEHEYDLVRQSFDYDILSELIEVFPRDITEKDRLQYLSREELEKKVIAATREEKDKRAIIEKLAKDLQDKVEDLNKSNTNILAYERALEEAKANVERQVAERTKQLLESQERLFKFLEIMPIGVFVFDRHGAPYYVNATLKRLIGNDIRDLVTLPPIKRAYQGESSSARDIEIDRGEKRIHLEVFASPIFDSANTVEFVIAAFHDITEEKVLERSREEFFSIASHELRTPLTAIRGLAWILEEEYAGKLEDKEFKTMINDIYSSSVRLIGLVNDFLNMSRLEQGRMVFKKEHFSMKELVEEVVKEYTIPAQEKGLYLKGMVEPTFPGNVFADRSKVKEVLINFIGNAMKFTEHGGLTIYLSQELRYALVRVADTGSGIPRENQALLFRKFQQAGRDIYARDMSQGSGLGLYISKLMIQGMGGSIGLESSAVEKGSIFFFSLPLEKPETSGTMK